VYSSKRWEGEREREKRIISAQRERERETQTTRSERWEKSYKNRISFFLAPAFFFEISFFWEGWPKRKRRGGGGGVMVVRERQKKNTTKASTNTGDVDV